MSNFLKDQSSVLKKLGITQLNPMQEEAKLAISSTASTILLSPTGTGKTIAFLLPVIGGLTPDNDQIQALILVPSRELAIQIEQVCREMGTGYKVNAIYGGRPIAKDKVELQHLPAILIGTPGRIADHLRRQAFTSTHIQTLVLDEFDKALEVGFESEMKEIISLLPALKKRVLTSATHEAQIPSFVGVSDPIYINYLDQKKTQLSIQSVTTSSDKKLDTLRDLIFHIGNKPGIVFCNFKNTIQEVSTFLTQNHIQHGCFYGGMEQKDRERALIKFRNGTHQILVATDLAARGIDISELQFIIHYQLPLKSQEFIHRNGRTARMHNKGIAYIIDTTDSNLPEFIHNHKVITIQNNAQPLLPSNWITLFISGGRKDKISKGDIAGLLMKQGGLSKDQVGGIELKQDCAFVAVHPEKNLEFLKKINNTRLKKKKVRITKI
ncbi:DEAD/DEAH box helicase [Aquimarina hainanensis]|uniref:DEAD/DEAH box helicase n=1 Tax=Aquimarina hainanensis TaxID=1578017 RepID=A0ABW5N481_9FLAO